MRSRPQSGCASFISRIARLRGLGQPAALRRARASGPRARRALGLELVSPLMMPLFVKAPFYGNSRFCLAPMTPSRSSRPLALHRSTRLRMGSASRSARRISHGA